MIKNGATTATPFPPCRLDARFRGGQATILPFERLRASPRRRERGFTGRASHYDVVAFSFNDGLEIRGCTSNAAEIRVDLHGYSGGSRGRLFQRPRAQSDHQNRSAARVRPKPPTQLVRRHGILEGVLQGNGDSALCLSYPFGDSPPRYWPESRDCRPTGPQAACGTDQNALLITPPSTRTAAPVVAEANGLAR